MVGQKNRIIGMVRQYCMQLTGTLHVDKAVLFGSFAKEDYQKDSDVDLIIISKDFGKMPFLKRLELLSLKWPFCKAADIIGYTPKEYREFAKTSMVVRAARKEGVTVFSAK